MSKSYASGIESKLRTNSFGSIAELVCRFGKYKGYPVQIIETRLKEWVKELREHGYNDIAIAQMIDGEWLHK